MKKPKCKLIGKNGNIFNLVGIAKKTLKENNMEEEADKMLKEVFESKSYHESLAVISKYVEII